MVANLKALVMLLKNQIVPLGAQRNDMPEQSTLHGRLALEAGIESYRAYGRWAKKALRQFKEGHS